MLRSPTAREFHGKSGSYKRKLRDMLCEAQNWRCCYCGVRLVDDLKAHDGKSVDRVVPGSAGGGYAWSNCVAACKRCNELRSSMDAYRFARLLELMDRRQVERMIRKQKRKRVRALGLPWPRRPYRPVHGERKPDRAA